MVALEMKADNGHISVRFDVPDKTGEKLLLDELATFALHFDVIKDRITSLVNTAISKGEGFDLIVDE